MERQLTGGPSLEQFLRGYNQLKGTEYSIEKGNLSELHTWGSATVYNPHPAIKLHDCWGYWLATAVNEDGVSVWLGDCAGCAVTKLNIHNGGIGIRPLVKLPTNAKMNWNGTAWDLSD